MQESRVQLGDPGGNKLPLAGWQPAVPGLEDENGLPRAELGLGVPRDSTDGIHMLKLWQKGVL
jgi:hypothetical protein